MANIIRINEDFTVDNIDIDFDRSSGVVNKEIKELIGCDHYQTFGPNPLVELFNTQCYPYEKGKTGIIMLLDDEGAIKENPSINIMASILAGADIFGKCLVVGTTFIGDGFDYCELPNDWSTKITALIRGLAKEIKEQIKNGEPISPFKGANECIACIKLNKENGNTLPLICPKTKALCSALNRDKFRFWESKENISEFLFQYMEDISMETCIKENKINQYFRVLQENINKGNSDLTGFRVNMDKETFVDQDFIKSGLEFWDNMIKAGNKELYTYERY